MVVSLLARAVWASCALPPLLVAQGIERLGSECVEIDGKEFPLRAFDSTTGIEFLLVPQGTFVFGNQKFLPLEQAELKPLLPKKDNAEIGRAHV